MNEASQEPDSAAPHALAKPLTLAATIAALGVVFGDIGTSPLYAFKECLRVKDAAGNFVGVSMVVPTLSLIIWSLILVVMFKYVLLVMEANEDGEGGIMTLVSLASSKDPAKGNRKHRSFLVLLGVFGAALLYGDGVITPAISVVSALEGVKEANERLHGPLGPEFLKYFIPSAAIIILGGIFWLQKIGTGKVGLYFGPITMIWFIVIGGLGALALALNSQVFGEIIWALNPLEGIKMLLERPTMGILILGAVFLSVTGAEALYADMGHFGQKPIRAAWSFIVFPALILNYFGQGAWALAHPDELLTAGFNPFFNMAPNWAQIPLVVIATLAAIIASQALIAGAFSITMQAIQLNYLPRMRVVQTSDVESGQVYVPIINWLLMIGSMYLVLHYENSENLASAYGIAVSLTMLVTTILFGQYVRHRLKIPSVAAYALLSPFIILELLFVLGNTHKILPNGWMPLAIGVVVYYLMSVWNKGRIAMKQKLQLGAGNEECGLFLDSVEQHFNQGKMSRVKGTAIYLAGSTKAVPMALAHNLKHNKVLHDHIIIVTLKVDDGRAIVPTAERVRFDMRRPKFCRLDGHEEFPAVLSVTGVFGFREKQDVFTVQEAAFKELGINPSDLDTTYFLSRETIVRATSGISLDTVQEKLFEVLNRNSLSATAYFNLPPGRVVELGMQVEL